ncbi:cGMP-specific 3' [Dinothrombium tinctorium]|uniref:cGMP-specific 3 n=1 Tax=Dinothrombium tinctorium TaxID=1965070 RepID=A0A3S3RH65_9ACAR|nr:cGMP-specific 3' [Dinothrombium tinctorium]
MTKAKGLLRCEACRVYLVDTEGQEFEDMHNKTMEQSKSTFSKELLFLSVFELKSGENEIKKLSFAQLKEENENNLYETFARQVALSGQTYNWNSQILDKQDTIDSFQNQSVLSIPILSATKKVIGVAQLINKAIEAHFTEVDIATFELTQPNNKHNRNGLHDATTNMQTLRFMLVPKL